MKNKLNVVSKVFVSNCLLCLFLLGVNIPAFATDFSGVYQCDGFDYQDGKYTAKITLKINNTFSKKINAHKVYDFSMEASGYDYTWTGYAVANGANIAIYFESTGPKKEPSDKGVGIATVVVDLDSSGNELVTLHKFFYEQAFKGKPDYGSENCRLVK